MDEKKKARWEENKELIEQQQMKFNELDDRYKALKELTAAMINAHIEMVKLAQQNNRYALGRYPDRIKNKAKKLKQMLLNLGED